MPRPCLRRADDLRFRLLLPEADDLKEASLELKTVLSPFCVLDESRLDG